MVSKAVLGVLLMKSYIAHSHIKPLYTLIINHISIMACNLINLLIINYIILHIYNHITFIYIHKSI